VRVLRAIPPAGWQCVLVGGRLVGFVKRCGRLCWRWQALGGPDIHRAVWTRHRAVQRLLEHVERNG
jgi:hypothetical protein